MESSGFVVSSRPVVARDHDAPRSAPNSMVVEHLRSGRAPHICSSRQVVGVINSGAGGILLAVTLVHMLSDLVKTPPWFG